MLKIACFFLVIATTTPLWSQVEPAANGGGFDLDDSRMMTPPPVSGDAYPVVVGSESRSNYIGAGLIFTAAHTDNLLIGGETRATGDQIYSFLPSFNFDRRTPRQGESLHYSAGFDLYQDKDQLSGVNQDATADYRFHVSPYTVLDFHDELRQNNNLFNQGNPFAGGGVSGSPGSNGVLIAPFENQLSNMASAGIEYQYARNAMIGGRLSDAFLQFSSSSNSQGLNNGNTAGGTAFYNRRIARSQYVGVTYQFSKFITHPIDTYTVTNTVLGFYTHYFTRSFSFSILGGPEHYTSWYSSTPKQGSWTPAVQGSFGWQALRTNIAVSFSHIVSGASGSGLIGTYNADLVALNGRFAFARRWSTGANAEYALLNPVSGTPKLFGFGTGGHTVSGGVNLQHTITESLYAEGGYAYFHESYPNNPGVSLFPSSNREYISINYGFRRPLGR